MTIQQFKTARSIQNDLKLNYLSSLKVFSSSLFSSSLLFKMQEAKELLVAFEKSLPGNEGQVSSVGYDACTTGDNLCI